MPGDAWRPHSGQQTRFLSSPAFEALFGGAAGPGKTDCLLMESLRQIAHPRYNAILFRRTFTRLEAADGLIARSERWFPGYGGKYNASKHFWRFPSGARIYFGHMQHEWDKQDYQGAQFAFCVAVGTLIRLADGQLRPIEQLRVGDKVLTLEGAKHITHISPRQSKFCIRADVFDNVGQYIGSQIQSSAHKFLTPQGWFSCDDLGGSAFPCGSSSPTEYYTVHKSASPSSWLCRTEMQFLDSRFGDRAQAGGWPQLFEGHQSEWGICEFWERANPGIGCVESACVPPIMQPPALMSVPVVLHSPSAQLGRVDFSREALRHGDDDARTYSSPEGYLDDYSGDFHLYGELLPRLQAVGQSYLQQSDGVGQQNPKNWQGDVGEDTHKYNQDKQEYPHPYTKKKRLAIEPVTFGTLTLSPCGFCETIDLTVEDASHYFTSTRLINQNCGFDELTEFEESQYLYLFTRVRVPPGVGLRAYARAATNPGNDGHEWVKRRFVTTDIVNRLHYFALVDGVDTPVGHDHPDALSRAFYPALLKDNPSADPDYPRRIKMNPDLVEQARLLGGDWDITSNAGRVYPNWSFENISEDADYHTGWPVYWGIDDGYAEGRGPGYENYHPRVILIGQLTPVGGLNIFWEYYRTGVAAYEPSIHEALSAPVGLPDDYNPQTWKRPAGAYDEPEVAYIDSSAAMFKGALWNNDVYTVGATHAVGEGIKNLRRLICDGNGMRLLKVHPRCKNLIREMAGLRYAESNVAQVGEPKVLKIDDHGPDGARYMGWPLRNSD